MQPIPGRVHSNTVQPGRASPADIDLRAVKDAELRAILGFRTAGAVEESPAASQAPDAANAAKADRKKNRRDERMAMMPLWGLALSGGGIRSATFSLGVLQILAREGLLTAFHYQSTVSGGGYAGALLQGLIRRRGFDRAMAALGARTGAGRDVDPMEHSAKDRQAEAAAVATPVPAAQQSPASTHAGPFPPLDAADAPPTLPDPLAFTRRPVRHLREYSNYLAPRKSPFSGDTLGMVGTYVRNVLLVQTQLCALILGASLLPLPVYALLAAVSHQLPWCLPMLASVLGVVAVLLLRKITHQVDTAMPTAQAGAVAAPPSTSVVVLAALVIVLLAGASLFGAAGLAGGGGLPILIDSMLAGRWTPSTPEARLGWTTAVLYVVAWVAWFVVDLCSKPGSDNVASPLQQHPARFLFAVVCAAVFARYAITTVQTMLLGLAAGGSLWPALTLGPVLTMAAITLTGIVQVGLAGPALSDQQREIWARVGGKTAALVVMGFATTLVLTIYGPWAFAALTHLGGEQVDGPWAKWGGWTGVLTWVGTTAVGLFTARGKRGEGGDSRGSRWLDLVARIAPWVFLLGLLVLVSLAGQVVLHATLLHFDLSDDSTATLQPNLQDYLRALDAVAIQHWMAILVLALAAFAVWALLGWAVDVNEFSLNAFYRNSLVRCYLGASAKARNPEPTTNFDVHDDLLLADVIDGPRLGDSADGKVKGTTRPLFPLVCATLNLVATKQLDWQDRKGASFCLSPLFCGYLPPDSRPEGRAIGDVALRVREDSTAPKHANDVLETPAPPPAPRSARTLAEALSLGGAISISGAAVSPNMGYHSSPAVTFLLTLFDARLGWWLPNLAHPRPPKAGDTPFFGTWLITEMLGRTNDGGSYVHLSDGGHFENLGLYELVRRRCRFVVCVDAAADPQHAFADLGNAVQKCRVDFGAEIDLDVAPLRPGANGLAERSCTVGRITYADLSTATLLYLKPTLTGLEPSDIQHYATAHPAFPHEPTADQYFDEAQFESYRRLGEDVACRALLPVLERVDIKALKHDDGCLTLDDSPAKTLFVRSLAHQWAPSLGAAGGLSARHGEGLSRLFQTLRETPELDVLDAQMYPAWTDVVPAAADADGQAATPLDRRTQMPAPEHFRTCFYFCQELIRLMESVHQDLDLERDWNHPDHRGWMSLFRHWSGSPMFRIAWTLGVPTFGARFVAFSEQRLGVPRFDNHDADRHVIRIESIHVPHHEDWLPRCAALLAEGRINHVEHALLTARAAMLGDPATYPDRLILLKLKWDMIVPRDGLEIRDTTLGVMALSGKTIRLMRLQDRMQRLGLGTEFLRLVVEARIKVKDVLMRPGHYGLAGQCHDSAAKAINERLRAMLRQARSR